MPFFAGNRETTPRYFTFSPLDRKGNEFASSHGIGRLNTSPTAASHNSTQLQTEVEERKPASSHIVRKPVPHSGSKKSSSHKEHPDSEDSTHHAIPRSKYPGTAKIGEAPSITNQSAGPAKNHGSHIRSDTVSSVGSVLSNQETTTTQIMRPQHSARIIDIAPRVQSQPAALAPARRPHRS